MGIIQLAAAVFIGNALTVAFVASLAAMYKKPDDKIPGWALAGAAFPLLFSAAVVYGFS